MVSNSSHPSRGDDGDFCLSDATLAGNAPEDVLFRVDTVLKLRSFRLAGNDGHLRDDLYQEGRIAVVRAIPRYDPFIGNLDGYVIDCAINRMRTVSRSHRYRRRRLPPTDFRPGAERDKLPPDLAEPRSERSMDIQLDCRHVRELVVAVLSPRERAVIEARYFRGILATKVAKALKVSVPRISQIEKGALAKLRVALGILHNPFN